MAAADYRDERAHALREHYGAVFGGADFPLAVEAVAEDLLGLDVAEVELDAISGLLYPAERRIFLNSADTPARRRFTLAHELGHWICQCVGRDAAPVYCRAVDVGLDPAPRALEREANIFAAELLMPEPAVRAAFAEAPSPVRLCSHFGVSPEAIAWRLYSFGLGDRPDGP